MKSITILISICLVIAYLGCAGSTKTPTVTEQSPPLPVAESISSTSDTEIPKSCKPMGKHEKGVQLVKEAFITLPSLKSVVSFTDMHVRDLANLAYLFATVESPCNLERIKGLVASGLSPVVIIESKVGARHARVIIGYDDSVNQLIATDPVNYRQIKMSYDSFVKSWIDPQKTCLLIHYQYDNDKRLRNPMKRLLRRHERAKSADW